VWDTHTHVLVLIACNTLAAAPQVCNEFYDVYSDEFFKCVDPMSRAGSSRGVQTRFWTM